MVERILADDERGEVVVGDDLERPAAALQGVGEAEAAEAGVGVEVDEQGDDVVEGGAGRDVMGRSRGRRSRWDWSRVMRMGDGIEETRVKGFGLPRGRLLLRRAARAEVVEAFEADDAAALVLHEDGIVVDLLADVLLLRIVKPDAERVTGPVEVDPYLVHSSSPLSMLTGRP